MLTNSYLLNDLHDFFGLPCSLPGLESQWAVFPEIRQDIKEVFLSASVGTHASRNLMFRLDCPINRKIFGSVISYGFVSVNLSVNR